ncbi:MAG: winged helix DNA-binding domain-containing protein [bacterium]|nr:winged helix DNA-binding domain-containing protein [bacterium]
MTLELSKQQARDFLVQAHLLDGPKLKPGRASIVKVFKRFKTIQVDSIDVCGTSQDIALASRIENHTPDKLYDFLYGKNRGGFEYWSKCLSILPKESKPIYEFRMRKYRDQHSKFLDEHKDTIRDMIKKITDNGPMGSSDFNDARKVGGGWFENERLIKWILQWLWDTGDLMIHHRKRRVRFYDLTERCIPWSDKKITEEEFRHQIIIDRLSAMRMTRTKGPTGEIWHGLREVRDEQLSKLHEKNKVIKILVEGCKSDFWILSEDKKLLNRKPSAEKSVRFLAPLDSIMWDRSLVQDIFDFEAKFEIYHVPHKRRWGYYCLPILYGCDLVGRVDLARDKVEPSLNAISIHWEKGFKLSDEFLHKFALALCDHQRFLGLDGVQLPVEKFTGKDKLKKLLKR